MHVDVNGLLGLQGRLRVCFDFLSRPHVSCRFLLLRSAASLTTRSLCAGGVSKQGRAPDMVEGKILLPVLCFRLFCSEVTGPRPVDLLPLSQTFPSKWNIWFLSSEIVYSLSHNERPILWFTSSLWQKCCHLHSVISQPSVSVPEVVLVCAPVLMVRSGSIDVVEALPLFSILSLVILASFPHLLSSCLIPPTWLASREEETRGDI